MNRTRPVVALLHPGAMGAAVGRQATSKAQVLWLPEGRSTATAARADAAGLQPVADLATLVRDADAVISLCPPQFADRIAAAVLAAGFDQGVFLDANALIPQRMAAIGELFAGTAVRVVDGSIIGPPPTRPGTTRLYLAGPTEGTSAVTDLFAGSGLEAVPISGEIGAASALKTAQAVFQKASRALACLAHASRRPLRGRGRPHRGRPALSPADPRRTRLPSHRRGPRVAVVAGDDRSRRRPARRRPARRHDPRCR